MPVDLLHLSIAFLFAVIWLIVIQIVVSERRRLLLPSDRGQRLPSASRTDAV